jgi:acyl carrier protein
VNASGDIETVIEKILRKHGPDGEIEPSLPLGRGGLALDSIALVEVLLACEEHFGVILAAELLAGEPLTVGRLADRVRRSLQP